MLDTETMESNFNPFPTERVINKLFLVGNGFDLSLGLKTRYEDFLLWYFKKFLNICLINSNLRLIQVQNHGYLYHEDELLSVYNKYDYRYSLQDIDNLTNLDNYNQIKKYIEDNINNFTYKFNSNLFESVYNLSHVGWVDIEKSYYDLLKEELKKSSNSNIIKLNNDLKIIKNLLKEYLETLDYTLSKEYAVAIHYTSQFLSKIKADEVIYENPDLPIATNKMLFLNFNYTPALSHIISLIPVETQGRFNAQNCKLNHIHGIINNPDNDLIFGYGDEMDKDYKEIEELNDNSFLENFKSFKYNHSSNYRDLLRFVNSGNYQVCIYGHSCGLSDRVMLNEIFEHDNCKSIKIYYYNKEEFINKNMDISRHFNSNKLMRQRIVEFNVNDKIPQMVNKN